jgi:hypothetical protein
MCYSGCPYENFHGECTGMGRLKKGRPHCFNEVTDEEWIAEAEEQEAYDDDDDEYF